MLKIGSVQHKLCTDVLSGHTSTAELAQVSQLALLFRNAHAIAKAGRPFSDMQWMKGLDVGMSYRTDLKRSRENLPSQWSGSYRQGLKKLLAMVYNLIKVHSSTKARIVNPKDKMVVPKYNKNTAAKTRARHTKNR